MKILEGEGEKIPTEELTNILRCLVGDEAKALKGEINAEHFAKEVLGFEEIQDEEEDEGAIQGEQIVYAEGDTGLVPEDPNEYVEGSPGKSSSRIHA